MTKININVIHADSNDQSLFSSHQYTLLSSFNIKKSDEEDEDDNYDDINDDEYDDDEYDIDDYDDEDASDDEE